MSSINRQPSLPPRDPAVSLAARISAARISSDVARAPIGAGGAIPSPLRTSVAVPEGRRSRSSSPESRPDGALTTPFVSAPSSPTDVLRPTSVVAPAAPKLAAHRVWAWLTGTVDRLSAWTTEAKVGPWACAPEFVAADVHVDGRRMRELLAEASEPARRRVLLERLCAEPGPTLVLDDEAKNVLADALGGEPNTPVVRRLLDQLQLDPLTRYVALHPLPTPMDADALSRRAHALEPLSNHHLTQVRMRARSCVDATRIHVHYAECEAWDFLGNPREDSTAAAAWPIALSILAPLKPQRTPSRLPHGRSATPYGQAPLVVPPPVGSEAYLLRLARQRQTQAFRPDHGERRMPLLCAPVDLGRFGTVYRTAVADVLLPAPQLGLEAFREPETTPRLEVRYGWYKPHSRPAIPLELV